MSLRSYRDQIALEEVDRNMTPEQERVEREAWRLPKERVRDEVDCPTHVAKLGVYCARAHGTYYVCKARRMRAAYQIAGVERP